MCASIVSDLRILYGKNEPPLSPVKEWLHLLNYSFPQFSDLLRNINTHPEITLLQISAVSFMFIFLLSVFSSRKRHFSGVALLFSTLGYRTNDEWHLI